MLADLSFIIACAAFVLGVVSMYIYKTILDENRAAMEKIWSRLHYVEIAMSYHDMVPLPWEMEDFNEKFEEVGKINKLKRDGNIVYLKREDE